MKIADQLREAHRNKKSPASMLKAADQLESQQQEILQLRQALEKTSKAAQVLKDALEEAYGVKRKARR